MVIPENRLFCRLDGLTVQTRSQHRLAVLTELGLLEPDSAAVFEEAVQTAVQATDVPIAILSVIEPQRESIKSATGLSRLGLMNPLSRERQWPIDDSWGIHVVDSQQVLILSDVMQHPTFASSLMAQQYGIRAYVGVPLITSKGDCIGVLAVLSLQPHEFTPAAIEFLVLTARLAMSEYERQQLLKPLASPIVPLPQPAPQLAAAGFNPATPLNTPLKFELLAQLTQELRTPLTSVMGMASVLTREIYGPLTHKQKEYLDIIHHSGEYLLSLVQEVLELSSLDLKSQTLNLASVDIEMLCQQAIATLDQVASRRDQQVRLSVEPGNRIWQLDKEKIRQMLYHMMFGVIQTTSAGSIVRLHVANKGNGLKLTLWTTHPHLGEGMAYGDDYGSDDYGSDDDHHDRFSYGENRQDQGGVAMMTLPKTKVSAMGQEQNYQKNLGLLLGRQLVELHSGQIQIQGTGMPGYRYVITLPRLAAPKAVKMAAQTN